jgi:hypothetical protein
MQNSRYSYAHGGLSSLKEARDLLHSHAPKGEHLAYINPKEAALLKANGGSGIMTASGIRSYGFLSKITKPIAKVLGKIIPNEIKPALPFAAAFAPFLFPGFTAGIGSLLGGSGTIAGLSIPEMIGSGVLKAGADLSQPGADKRGINLPMLGLNAITAGMAAPGSSEAIANERILGNINGNTITPTTSNLNEIISANTLPTLDVTKANSVLESIPNYIPPNLLQNTQNLLNTGLSTGAKYLEVPEGGLTPFSGNVKDFTTAAKKLLVPGSIATGEQAAIKAQEALDEYNAKLGNIKNMTQADLAERRKYVQQYMQLAGFNQSDIDSALSRQGLMKGGRARYETGSDKEGVKTIPINLDTIAKQLFGDRLDNLTYTQKETVYNRYYDLKDKKADGGLMNLKGHEMDFRAAGGFVPLGKKERADDVPARLSKNEFVFTAKAVRNAGHGDIKAGAKRMYQLMKHLEAR